MKIGVTGATGHLGRIVVEKLKEKMDVKSVVALVRSPQHATDLRVEIRKFDYNEPENLAASLEGIDRLLFISGNEVGKRVEQHANVIEAAKKAGVKLIAYTSLLRADTSALALAQEHLETEKILIGSGVPFVLLRHGWYTENYTTSLSKIVNEGILYGSSGDGKISAATRADFADAATIVITTNGHEGKIYELAGDEAFSMSDLASVISQVSGKKIEYKNLPANEYAALLVKRGVPEGVANFFADTDVSIEKGDLFDNSHQLSKLTGKLTTPLYSVIDKAFSKVAL